MENDQNQAPRPRPQIRPRGIAHNQTKRRTRRFGFHTFGDVGPILRHRGVESCMSLIVAKPEPQHNAARFVRTDAILKNIQIPFGILEGSA